MKKKKLLLSLTMACAAMVALGSCGGNEHKKYDESSSSVIVESSEVASSEASSSVEATSEAESTVESSIESSIESSEEQTTIEDLTYSQQILNNMSCGGVVENMTDFTQYLNTDKHVKVSTAEEFLNALSGARLEYTNEITDIDRSSADAYKVRDNVRKNETNWINAITKGLYIYDSEKDEYVKIPSDTPFSDETYTADMVYYEDSPYPTVTFTQELTKAATVNVIEITEDLDLGYNLIKDLGCDTSVYENWDKNSRLAGSTDVWCDPDIQAAGIAKIKISNCTDLLIFSKNGAKITHAGFQISSCKNVAVRNLNMDEIWMWEDSRSKTPTITVGDYDSFGWAYFKVSYSENIWIDHCTFGKSFDGQIDFSNPWYSSIGTYSNAPYGATGSNGLHISYCNFTGGSDDPNGYIYKMLEKLEAEYEVYCEDPIDYEYTNNTPSYYIALRELGLSFEDILYGVAIPQKKAFLWNDSGDPYIYNKYMEVSITSCKLKNIEDRIPKVRGGIAYVYNCEVDNTEYLSILPTIKKVQGNLTKIAPKNAKGEALFKLACVSQGILSGLDASVYLESVYYTGINDYLKNNDSENDKYPTVNGGYMIKNSIIGTVYGSIEDDNNPFATFNKSGTKLSPDYFSFKVNGEKTNATDLPIEIDGYDVVSNGSLDGYFEDAEPGVNDIHSIYYWATSKY